MQPETSRPDTVHKAIIFDDVSIAFEDITVLDGVSFELKRGETKAVLGVAGSGKSTILKICLGLIKPDRGHVYVLGHDVTTMSEEELFDLRNKVGIVFQESALFDSLTVRENVAFRLMEEKLPESEIEKRVREALSFVEMEEAIDKLPSELSGGMRRRVGIARAIINEPSLMLYDSPTSGLDQATSHTINILIAKLRVTQHVTSVVVTHLIQTAYVLLNYVYSDQKHALVPAPANGQGSAATAATRFLVLRDGGVYFQGGQSELAAAAQDS